MRLAGRASLLLALMATLALTAGAAGCGGDDDGSEEANVPEITVPAGEPQTVPEETTTAPETTTTPPDSGGGGGGGGGGNADPSKPDSPTNDIPPEPGTPQAKFEQFCEENPGACG